MTSPSSSGPAMLAGTVVVEIATRPAGGYCGRLLAVLGASVTRIALPPSVDCPVELTAAYESSLHDGKVSVDPRDERAVTEAVGRAALLIVDSRDDDASDGEISAMTERWLGVAGPEVSVVDIADHRDALVVGGPRVPATGLTAAAASGMAWCLGLPEREPLTLPFDVPEYLAGTEAAAAGALAVLLATAGFCGRRWDVTTTDVLSYYVGQIGANFLPYERPWRRDGPRATMSGGSYPAAMFPCRDGWISIMCRTPREYQGLVAAMGEPEWSTRPGFDDPRVVARLHADEVDPYLIGWTSVRSRDEVFAAGQKHGFPVAPVSTVAEAMAQEQFAHRGFFVTDEAGRTIPGSPYHLTRSATVSARRSAWPAAEIDSSATLAGLRVLDLSWVWSGPMVTAALRDLGAEVIKVEHRGRADPARLRGRAVRGGLPVDGPELEVTPYFNQMNHAKRSVAIDMGTEEGVELIRRLAAESDVVVENMRPGALARRGLGYADLSIDNPGLVMVSMSMLGQSGPLSGIRGYAPVMSGLAGLDSLVGYDTDTLIGTFNPALGDPNGAGHALVALLAGLVGRRRTGYGCHVDLAQVEALLSILRVPVLLQQDRGAVPVPANEHPRWSPHGIFAGKESDTWVAVAARTPRERATLESLTGGGNGHDHVETLSAWIATRNAGDTAEVLRAVGVPASEVAGFEAAIGGKRAFARGVGNVVSHPYLGEQSIVTVPWKLDGSSFPAAGPAPLLGADTGAVLDELLGLAPDTIAGLRDRKVIELGHDGA
ncbi:MULTISPECIES: CoA transferase [unclassified Pseudonocardia]|uniref:CaiB/BaiF CoA-transferase family protein n=1 Tax=unclassified Pseudonocardia TaxID=2619320 RepID=UPI001D03C4CA|nr:MULTISPECIES: CoA transferase [unclassified Pseudonocardia]